MGPSELQSLCDHRRGALAWPEEYVHTGYPVQMNPYVSLDSVTKYVQMVQNQQEQALFTSGQQRGALGMSMAPGASSITRTPRTAREIKEISSRHSARKGKFHKKMEQSAQR